MRRQPAVLRRVCCQAFDCVFTFNRRRSRRTHLTVARCERDATGERASIVPSFTVPASGTMTMWVRASELAKFTASALLMTLEPAGAASIGSLRLRLNSTSLELLEFRESNVTVVPSAANNASSAVDDGGFNSTLLVRDDFARVLALPLAAGTVQQLSAGAYVFVAMVWNQTHACLFAGRALNEASRCVAQPLQVAVAQTSGSVLAIGGLASEAPEGQFVTVPVDIDTFLLTKDSTTPGRRRRGWYDRDDPQLAVAATFEPTSGGAQGECPCGTVAVANLARKSATPMLQFVDVDCNVADCARAGLLTLPSSSVEGSVSRLRGSGAVAELATHVSRLCNASIEAVQPAKLSHAYRVLGNGTLISASTCRFTASDTRIYVFRADLCPLIADTNDRSKCIAANDNSLRGQSQCPNGGAEVTWRGEVGVEYLIVVVAPDEKPVVGAAATATFALDVQSCAAPRCGSLPSCFPCTHLSEPEAPLFIAIRDKTVTRSLSFESRCVGAECEGAYSIKVRVPVQASVARSLPAPQNSAALVFRRGNARITLTPVAVAPAVYVEPDFNSSTGNDNALFMSHFSSSGGFGVKSDSILLYFCANPLPVRYRFVLLDNALPSQLIETNTTCALKESARARNSSAAPTMSLTNDKCGEDYQVERIRCHARPLPSLGADIDTSERAVSVCRPDLELAGLRAAVEADPALAETRRQLVSDALKNGEAAVDCNVPPIPSDGAELLGGGAAEH
jgi:hypothetical protein